MPNGDSQMNKANPFGTSILTPRSPNQNNRRNRAVRTTSEGASDPEDYTMSPKKTGEISDDSFQTDPIITNNRHELITLRKYLNTIKTTITECKGKITVMQRDTIYTVMESIVDLVGHMNTEMSEMRGELKCLRPLANNICEIKELILNGNKALIESYAQKVKKQEPVVKINPNLPPITRNNAPPGPARPSVLIFPSNNIPSTSESTLKTLKTAINPTELGIRVTGMRELKRGGVLIHPSTSAEASKLANDPALIEAGLKATIAPNRLPRIAIHNLPQDTSTDVIINAIHHQSSNDTGLSVEDLRLNMSFSHKSGPRTGNCIHIYRVPPSVRHSLISRTNLAVDWQLHRVRDWVDSLKCGHCQLYGHIASKCQADSPTCPHCAKIGHNRDACPKKEKSPVCATCTFFRKPASHNTGSQDCPARQAAERRELSRVNFLG